MLFAIFSGGWREKYPGFVRVGRGISHAHALRGVGFAFPKTTVALALGGNALNGAVKIGIGDGGQFHSVFNKKTRAWRVG